jgi:hypothetical protein
MMQGCDLFGAITARGILFRKSVKRQGGGKNLYFLLALRMALFHDKGHFSRFGKFADVGYGAI